MYIYILNSTHTQGGAYRVHAQVYDPVHYALTPVAEGQSPHILVTASNPNIRTDVSLSDRHILKLWGQFKNIHQLPLYKANVLLFQVACHDGHIQHQQIATTLTDSSGFYFIETILQLGPCYKLIVHAKNPLNNRVITPPFTSCPMPQALMKHCHETLLHSVCSLSHPKKGDYYI